MLVLQVLKDSFRIRFPGKFLQATATDLPRVSK